ncbi:hypothetical protein COW98_01000 [Candidatus Roizmanbacteria bacterium CG22_combo_CG10-13_8_21_14_all_35_9]|uniref:YdbS-like PH domain-containing protein n=3 Tax=Candidatus Roizmaniibacteriota TaxID=1752723 RepID=A0A2M8F1R5_9BACT|nr:MAG: hypothetical protein COW98_01000 [Candidatus Roizmanbacteria bacterium CG22_combo_CG10-13_8_21_14_all_35_9]PIY71402.1 MAG: hypothetical protein COY88_00530 [Candidatus Roizmanbacteria bacterium CG_4_10_14_0_8_um_filter_35_28]PJC33217.1 MAG: hypothetical protein CO048_03580 [Candidatus Roizmanbacteria bacterium CG_4_9_14_0_2_um_filter_35_15]PJC82672.1 MAG: hypothetical protein CO006_02410 [Candidatus Roizmanbacteria bacterium CG_4_8_14_3_um_filter_35_14]
MENKVFFSYCLYPEIKFETYEPGEKIILLLRAHPFTQLSWILYSVFSLILIFVVNIIISSFFAISQLFLLNCFMAVFLLSFIWFNLLNWYFNVGIVTNRRVIDIDFYAVLYREITVARLDKIQDITVKSGGYFEAFFNYGTIFIQTAGTEANIEFADIPRPAEVVQMIEKLLTKRHGT